MSILKIDGTDYSANVVAESYNVNRMPIVQEWTDAGQYIHRDIIGYKIRGNFRMYFDSETNLQTFLTFLTAHTSSDSTLKGTIPFSLKCNNYEVATRQSINAFVSFEPVRKLNASLNDTFEIIEVSIEER